jgi:hypothetical protein
MQTVDQLQELDDPARKMRWLRVIQSEVLYPLVKVYNRPLVFHEFAINNSTLASLKQKDFYHFVDVQRQVELLMHILEASKGELSIDKEVMEKFIWTVSCNYNDNPYHNFTHAFSITQMLFSMGAMTDGFSSHLERLEYFALLVAAMGHDLDHRKTYVAGVTNAFMVAAGHELATRYNDTSVLENHHAASLFKLFEMPGCQLFSQQSSEV